MDNQDYIKLDIICTNYKVQKDLVYEFYEFGLVEIYTVDPDEYLHKEEITKLEKVLGFYRDLDINLPGIEVINHLLDKIEQLQTELGSIKKQLEIKNKNSSE